MSKLLNLEEMMLVGGGCSRGLSRAVREYNKNKDKTKIIVKNVAQSVNGAF
ncbi:hypothetical protein [Vibrio sp. 1F279]|uniref:hypothetical protein n=1 Tax=unclassified Vibrio TaxID=2614977 RepID=UPI00352F056A